MKLTYTDEDYQALLSSFVPASHCFSEDVRSSTVTTNVDSPYSDSLSYNLER